MHTTRRIHRRRYGHGSLSTLLLAASLVVAVGPISAQRPTQAGVTQTKNEPAKKQPPPSDPRFTSADGGRTLHDDLLHVTWLLEANLGASECRKVDDVGSGGGMAWKTAWACIAQLNTGKGFLGHTNWQMPATPKVDSTCGSHGKNLNWFAADCSNSSYGSLFYKAWNRHYGETVALETGSMKSGFRNLQPTLYWYGNKTRLPDDGKKEKNGYNSFSFANGWQGANVNNHVMYVLPMIAGPVPAGSPVAKATIADRTANSGVPGKSGINWLADANVASDPQFVQAVKAGSLNIRKDGSMNHEAAQALIDSMNKHAYLGRNDWMLPLADSAHCEMNGTTGKTGGYHCDVSGMGHLYYDVLKLSVGSPTSAPPDIPEVKPFTNVQPSLYWACMAATPSATNTQAANLCDSDPTAAPGYAFSFDMGNGFTDTTLFPSELYLMIYYPDPPVRKCTTPAQCCMQAGGTMSGGKCR